MLISRTWISELLIDPRDKGLGDDDRALGDAITSLGLEVEDTTRVGAGLEAILVGEVRAVGPHPGADRLRVVELYDGQQTLTVVCGAPNVPESGGKVAFAPVGTTLPGGLSIGAREVRGVQSHGMICSEQELEIGPDHEGIMVLPAAWAAGRRLCDVVPGLVDTIFELSITPNRPDALGHVGVARDLAVKRRMTLVAPPLADPVGVPPRPELVTIEAPDRCGRYHGYAFEGARVGPSPLWVRVRLHRLGLRPINNVVDITNLVQMEWGQPLHAFDHATLAEGRVVVRLARPGESLRTLDDRELALEADDLVIADGKEPQALAGVMGGARSGVTEASTTLLLEAAWFAPRGIRRTARRHQIQTDSSYRFERGVDYGQGLTRATARAFGLIMKLTGARCVGGEVARGQCPPPRKIPLRPARTTLVLGMSVPDDEARRILIGLDLEVDDSDPARWICRAPTHRPDLGREEDLIEELMRHHGLEDLPAVPSMPTAYGMSAPTGLREPGGALLRHAQDRLVDVLAAQGLHETVGFAFAEPERLARVTGEAALAGAVRLKNPMRGLGPVLRSHLLPGLLDAAALNLSRHSRVVRLFEVGRIYRWGEPPAGEGPTAAVDRRLPEEPLRAGVLLASARAEDDAIDGRAMAGVLLDALQALGLHAVLRPAAAEQVGLDHLHPGIRAHLEVAGRTVGSLGAVHPDLVAAWDLPDDTAVIYGELTVDHLPAPQPVGFAAIPRFPATSRDLSLDLAVEIPAAEVVRALVEAEAALDDDDDPPRLSAGDEGRGAIEVLEDYRGEGIADGRRALLLRLHYRAQGRSVTDSEVQARHDQVVNGAQKTLIAVDKAAQPR